MDTATWFQSKRWRAVLPTIGGLIILLLVFRAGAAVGYRKARFSYRWGENYHRNFGGPRGGFLRDAFDQELIDAHGTAGVIMDVDGLTMTLRGRDDVERIVRIGDKTIIKQGRATVGAADLSVDDRVVVIGNPNDDGQIEAQLIRVFPSRNRQRSE